MWQFDHLMTYNCTVRDCPCPDYWWRWPQTQLRRALISLPLNRLSTSQLYLAEDMNKPKAQRKEVATWRNTTIAITKGGELNIDPVHCSSPLPSCTPQKLTKSNYWHAQEYAHEKELIIFSALGLHGA